MDLDNEELEATRKLNGCYENNKSIILKQDEERCKKYVGKYIRNQYGIAKIIDVFSKEDIVFLKLDNKIVYKVDAKGMIWNDDLRDIYPITERTQNSDDRVGDLTSLIEVGDYINGSKLIKIDYAEDKDGNCDKAHFYYEFEDCEKDINEYYEDLVIESIVTREQFEKIKYNVNNVDKSVEKEK